MDPVITPSAQLYGISTSHVERALRDVDEDQALERLDGHTNCMLWLFGHLAVTRCNLGKMCGLAIEVPWKEIFGKGADGGNVANFPKLAEIQKLWQDITPRLLERFETLTDEELSAPAPRAFPVPDKTMRGAISFLAYHEAYHVGQLAYLRKSMKQENVTG